MRYHTFHECNEVGFNFLYSINVAELSDNVQNLPGVPVLLLQLTSYSFQLDRYLQQDLSIKFCFATSVVEPFIAAPVLVLTLEKFGL